MWRFSAYLVFPRLSSSPLSPSFSPSSSSRGVVGVRAMAAEEAKVLRDYEQVLTDLTFNSRPLITHLTIAAEQYSGRRQLAKKIVAAIQKRIYEVVPALASSVPDSVATSLSPPPLPHRWTILCFSITFSFYCLVYVYIA